MTAHRIARLGGDRVSQVLRGLNPLRHVVETEFFEDRQFVLDRNAALAAALSGRNFSQFASLLALPVPDPVVAQVEKPFLFLVVDWKGDGSDLGYYSELDLANSRHQMLGKITQVGDFGRAFGQNRELQRMSSVSIMLEDIDRSIATRVRKTANASNGTATGQYNYARFYFSVGHPLLTEDYYSKVSCPFRVQRLGGITDTTVEFQLIDASDDLLIAQIAPPINGVLVTSKVGPTPERRRILAGASFSNFANEDWFWQGFGPTNDTSGSGLVGAVHLASVSNVTGDRTLNISFTPSNTIPMPFGGWTKSPFAWATNWYYPNGSNSPPRNNPVALVVLGVSKKPDWMGPHYWGDCNSGPAKNVRNEPIIYGLLEDGRTLQQIFSYDGANNSWVPNGQQGITAYIDVHQVIADSPTALHETWYVAVLYVALNSNSSTDDANTWNFRRAMSYLAAAASKGTVYIDWNGISASTTWGSSEQAVAAQALGYLVQYHSFTGGTSPVERGPAALRGETRVIENYDDALTSDGLTGTPLGGAVNEARSGADVANEICATAMLDQAYSVEGRLLLRPAGVTARDLILNIPFAREIASDDIAEGSWREFAPRGDDRWGWGNLYRYSGAQEVAKILGWNGQASTTATGAPAGQVVQRTVEISFLRQSPLLLGSGGADRVFHQPAVAPYQREYATVQFEVPYSVAVGLELGNYLLVTYYAAANADGSKGWDRKLCRIDSLGVRWSTKRVVISVVVVDTDAAGVLLLADERWIQQLPFWRGGVLDGMTLTNGLNTVSIVTSGAGFGLVPSASWIGSYLVISPGWNPKPYPAADYATFIPSISFASKIIGVGAGLTLQDVAPGSGTFNAWAILYSHENPPPRALFTDFLDDPNDLTPWSKYAQMADSSTGLFDNGDPAQRFPGP